MNLSKAKVNKRIPKNRFKGDLSSVESIWWRYKIAKETTGINGDEDNKELQIFEITFKDKCNKGTLIRIQNSIPYRILYIVKERLQIFNAIVYNNVVISSDRMLIQGDVIKISAVTIASLYLNIIENLSGLKLREDETIDNMVLKFSEIKRLEQEVEKLIKRRDREQQPKKKIELNGKIKQLKMRTERNMDF